MAGENRTGLYGAGSWGSAETREGGLPPRSRCPSSSAIGAAGTGIARRQEDVDFTKHLFPSPGWDYPPLPAGAHVFIERHAARFFRGDRARPLAEHFGMLTKTARDAPPPARPPAMIPRNLVSSSQQAGSGTSLMTPPRDPSRFLSPASKPFLNRLVIFTEI